MVSSIWPEGNGSESPLPAPNVVVARSGTPLDELSPEAVKGILVNPIYTGVGPFPRLVQDDAWVRACARMIKEEGAAQVLVNLLYVLRECLGDGSSEESFGSQVRFPADWDRTPVEREACLDGIRAPARALLTGAHV